MILKCHNFIFYSQRVILNLMACLKKGGTLSSISYTLHPGIEMGIDTVLFILIPQVEGLAFGQADSAPGLFYFR